jgi:5-methylcytosine-specific restriction endonuclease McrBC GTP-binding regulatory subunit McrB
LNDFLEYYHKNDLSKREEISFENIDYESKKELVKDFTLSKERFDAIKNKVKNYVLIIDEINRANISRVFGELITLLEPSKRFGQDEELEVQLPSGDRFVVPPNLYVIGTMNTADKSIALLDIALRRRFDFVPVFPDMKWVDDKYRSFFDALNTKIAEMKSPDFTIGHSYFMEINGEEGIEKVMNNKVIPLLSEYFMNDLERVKSLLASVGVKIKTEHYGILRFESIDLSKTQKNGND